MKDRRICAILAVLGFATLPSSTAVAAPPGLSVSSEAERREISEFTARFLSAFENLDLPAFMRCFASDATVFFPVPEPPERVVGREAIQDRFQRVFNGIRQSAASGPPYHRLVPEKTQIQILGPTAALVSFELHNTERIARRTLVLQKSQGQWLIEHLHASNVSSQ